MSDDNIIPFPGKKKSPPRTKKPPSTNKDTPFWDMTLEEELRLADDDIKFFEAHSWEELTGMKEFDLSKVKISFDESFNESIENIFADMTPRERLLGEISLLAQEVMFSATLSTASEEELIELKKSIIQLIHKLA